MMKNVVTVSSFCTHNDPKLTQTYIEFEVFLEVLACVVLFGWKVIKNGKCLQSSHQLRFTTAQIPVCTVIG